jgi:hypothetical protein
VTSPTSPTSSTPEPADAAAEAKREYAAGVEAYSSRRYVEAALHFEAAAARRPHAAALYNAGLAWEQANRPDRAADDYGRALDVAGLSATQAQNARARIATLEKTLGTLVVTAPEGFQVQLGTSSMLPTPTRVHGAPAVHPLTIVAPGGAIAHRDVTLEAGKATPLALTEADVAPKPEPPKPAFEPPPKEPVVVAPPPPPPPREWWNLRRAVGVGVAGLGVATLASGVVLGVNALGARDAYNAGPTQAAYDHASSLETWTNVAWVSGVLLVAGGAALVLWPTPKGREPAAALVPTPGGVLVKGAF